ncbi:MAG: hypothetical protein ABIN91_16365 [Mucilaginibacter sp.]|uniref:hypothetical protein n=1 Tax=Mucilaginibacter sp. TaxID=1882438 RepID=UPI0032661C01
MDNIKISIEKDKQILTFEVTDYVHHESEHCKFEAFRDGEFVVGFEPDNQRYLHVCKNPGILDEEVLYLIADKIEAMSL